MGYQLWTSTLTGYRRTGTRFKSIKQLFTEYVTAKCIYEPLLSCPGSSISSDAKEALHKRDFDVAGVKETKDGPVIGYVKADEIADGEFSKYVRKIEHGLLISDSTPIADILIVLDTNDFAFVISGNQVTGIITKADINKPPVRIYIFGVISLFEMHLNLWITQFFQDNSWKSQIPEERIRIANNIYEQRKGNNQELTLLECLQLCDKRDLLLNSEGFLNAFGFSKNSFKTLSSRAERIRNELAHSQNSIIANMDWNKFIDTISKTESFLIKSDTEVEKKASEGTAFQDLLI